LLEGDFQINAEFMERLLYQSKNYCVCFRIYIELPREAVRLEEVDKVRELFPGDSSLNLDTLKGAIQGLAESKKKYKLMLFTFISKRDPIKLFKEWIPKEYSLDFKHHDDFQIVNVKRTINSGKKRSRNVKGAFGIFRYKKSDIWTCFTSASPDFFRFGLVRLIESYRPNISKIFLSSVEMRLIFEFLEEKSNGRIFVRKVVLYSHKEEGEIKFRLEKPFQEVFNEAENEEKYVDKIEYYIIKESKKIYQGFFSREGISYYYQGNTNHFFNSLLPALAEKGLMKSKIFTGKERRIGTFDLHPIEINYSKEMFNNRNDNIRLIKALSRVNKSAISVYHANPYLHLSFLDFYDGSNFEIMVSNANKICIFPNFKCSVHSLMRVIEQISKDFGEGMIGLSGINNYALDDFIG